MSKLRPTFSRFTRVCQRLEGEVPATKIGRTIKITSFLFVYFSFTVFVGVMCYSSYVLHDTNAIKVAMTR